MKSRGSSPRAAGWGVVCVRSTTPMCICPATAVTMSCSPTQALGDEDLAEAPAAVVLAGEGVVQLRLRDQAAGDEQAPSLRRPAMRCWRAPTSASILASSSSGRKGLVTNSAAPARWACSKVREVAVRTRAPRRGDATQVGVARDQAQQLEGVEGGEVEVEHDGRGQLVVQQAHRARIAEADAHAVGGAERPGELVEAARVSSSMIARVFLGVLGTPTSRRVSVSLAYRQVGARLDGWSRGGRAAVTIGRRAKGRKVPGRRGPSRMRAVRFVRRRPARLRERMRCRAVAR